MENQNFGQAIEALKQGKRVSRSGWNGKGMWLAIQEGCPAVRGENLASIHARTFALENGGTIDLLPAIFMKTADDKILTGWLASQTDMLAEDWCILD